MHPEDIRVERFKERIANLRELLDEDKAEVDAARKKINELIKGLYEVGVPQNYGEFLESVLKLFERIGRNRLEIRQLTIDFYESLDLVHRRIDILSEIVAGLDEHR